MIPFFRVFGACALRETKNGPFKRPCLILEMGHMVGWLASSTPLSWVFVKATEGNKKSHADQIGDVLEGRTRSKEFAWE